MYTPIVAKCIATNTYASRTDTQGGLFGTPAYAAVEKLRRGLETIAAKGMHYTGYIRANEASLKCS